MSDEKAEIILDAMYRVYSNEPERCLTTARVCREYLGVDCLKEQWDADIRRHRENRMGRGSSEEIEQINYKGIAKLYHRPEVAAALMVLFYEEASDDFLQASLDECFWYPDELDDSICERFPEMTPERISAAFDRDIY